MEKQVLLHLSVYILYASSWNTELWTYFSHLATHLPREFWKTILPLQKESESSIRMRFISGSLWTRYPHESPSRGSTKNPGGGSLRNSWSSVTFTLLQDALFGDMLSNRFLSSGTLSLCCYSLLRQRPVGCYKYHPRQV